MKKYVIIVGVLLYSILISGCSSTHHQKSKVNNEPESIEINPSDYRAEKNKPRKARISIDSIIMSHQYVFIPYNYQIQPAGKKEHITGDNFRMDVREHHIQVYLPFYYYDLSGEPHWQTVVGFDELGVLNNIAQDVLDYKATLSDDGKIWFISFSSNLHDGDTYYFKMTVTSSKGYAELEVSSSRNRIMSYNGYIHRLY